MRRLLLLSIAVLPLCFGCQAGIMFTRILMGDPKVTSAFEASTHIDLQDQEQPVYVVCTVPSVTTERYESLAVDLPDEVLRRMKRRGIPTEDASDAINLAADMGGRFNAYDVAKQLDEGYLVYIDLDRYSLSEDRGNTLYRGRATGNVSVYRIEAAESEDDSEPANDSEAPPQPEVTELFHRGIDTKYPGSHPVPIDQVPANVFQKRFEDHLADEVGRLLYSFRVTETL